MNQASPYAAFIACVFAVMFLTIAGCGPRRPETVAVQGRVLFDGQPPPKEGMVYFAPLEPAEGFPRRPGRAEFDAQGKFRATTFDGGDGLIPGRYRVGIDCWEILPQADGPPAKSLVPAAYREPATSGLELVVEPGARSMTVEFDVVAAP
ncbi:MAG: hypothetical protein RBS80_21905 [Thermoguttaceae bacterium]|jgi:hypothetical protein|nr:hypothetical protein [Thermoguttaceae bacterium]